MLASTTSSASLSRDSVAASSGERGSAIRPVLGLAGCSPHWLYDLTCSCALQDTEWRDKLHKSVDSVGLGRKLDNTIRRADIENLAFELMREICDGLEMLMLLT